MRLLNMHPLSRAQDYIASLNFRYRTELRTKKVEYLNARAAFIDAHTVELTDKKGAVSRKTAKFFMVATGGRPKYLGLENEKVRALPRRRAAAQPCSRHAAMMPPCCYAATPPHVSSRAPLAQELCITSDDLFSMAAPPGKTLVVGASYVALECAGFIAGLGYDTTVMMRSIPLRGFDQQCAEHICGCGPIRTAPTAAPPVVS